MSRAAIAGDIAGSRFERSVWASEGASGACCVGYEGAVPAHGGRGERAADFDPFHPDCFPTDDSVLTVAVMDWLLAGGDPRIALRNRFRAHPYPNLFGRYFRAWAASDGDEPCGSVGNGAAMRIAPVAYARDSLEAVAELARTNARATHDTEDAVAGAEAVAVGVFLARTGTPPVELARTIADRYGYDFDKPLDAWRPGYRFTSACDKTVPVAFRAFVETDSHEAAVRAAVSVGGDTDTVACIAGALAGAYWGITRSTADGVAARLESALMAGLSAFERACPAALRIVGTPAG